VAVSSSRGDKSINSSATLDDLCPTFRDFVVVSSSQSDHISILENATIKESQRVGPLLPSDGRPYPRRTEN
jgi:hypothetical protein